MASSGGTHNQMAGKASFEHIYDLEDPREYFSTLESMEYESPSYSCDLFSALAEHITPRGERLTILDLCCSYGVNGALLKHDVTLDELYAWYGSEKTTRMSTAELTERDREFYGKHRSPDAPRVIGLDVAGNAIDYGVSVGMLDEGVAENLEEHDPSGKLQRLISDVGLITITGGVSYITERTIDRLLDSLPDGERPWICALALRCTDYAPFAELLSRYGYVTERLDGHTFKQRRFADAEEQEFACDELSSMGIDPFGKEEEGSYHTYFYLSRPAEEAAGAQVEELVASALR